MIDFKTIKQDMLQHPDGDGMLNAAFTHRSYASEKKLKYDNQRLEFLGDAVLELITSTFLYKRYPEAKEGELTSMRSAMVREETLAALARGLQLGNMLRTGKGERENQGHKRDSTLADLFEALIGAYYMTCGYDAAEKMVLAVFEDFFPDITSSFEHLNPKGKLQELTQRIFGKTPDYLTLSVSGPIHDPQYHAEVMVENLVASGHGSSRRDAEAQAARNLLNYLISAERKNGSRKKR